MEFKKLIAPSLKEMFVEQIEEKILSGELSIGERMPPERNIAESMGISRSVVNSGLVELERMGFLEVKPRVGTFVADYRRKGTFEILKAVMTYNRGRLRDEEVRSILEIRDALEKLAVQCLIKRVTEEELQLLHEKVEKIRQSDTAEKASRMVFDFHHEVAVLSGNTLLPLIYRSFYSSISVLWERFCTLYGIEVLYKNSATLLDKISNRDENGAFSWIEHCTYEATTGTMQIFYR